MKKCIMTILFGILLVGFNNFDFRKWNHIETDSVNEASRISHAKELLGKGYRGSFAEQMEGSRKLAPSIEKKVQAQLKGKWKMQSQKISKFIISESGRQKFDPVFVMAVIQTESKFNPMAKGRHGEIGLMQLKPSTAAWIAQKYKIPWKGAKTLENPVSNIRLGIAYMSHLRAQFSGSSTKYVSAYNMGAKNVRKLFANKIRPKEYSQRILNNYAVFYSDFASAQISNLVASR